MPGSRPFGFYSGFSAERLAEFVLGGFAFTTPVPHPVDTGHDFHCVLHRPGKDGRTLLAGPAFSVQVKGEPGPVTYEAGPAAEWLADQESPLFLCIVDRSTVTCELYSTWNMRNGHLLKGALKTVLVPGAAEQFAVPMLAEDTLVVPLGHPVLRITPADVVDSADAMRLADILESWILIDRENIVNSRAGMYWVMGPTRWNTNEQLGAGGVQQFFSGFYHNPANLDRCVANVLRSAIAVRLIMDQFWLNGADMGRTREEAAVDALLGVFEPHLDDVARNVLRERNDRMKAMGFPGPLGSTEPDDLAR